MSNPSNYPNIPSINTGDWQRRTAGAVNFLLNRKVVTSVNGNSGAVTVSGGSGGGYSVASKSAGYTETAATGDLLVLCSGAFTINLPTAVGNAATLTFKVVSGGPVVLDGNASETIDGSLTVSINIGNALTLRSDSANWQVV